MRKIYISLICLAPLFLSSCEKRSDGPVASDKESHGQSVSLLPVTAVCGSGESGLRTTLTDDYDGCVVWSENDRIRVFSDDGQSAVLSIVEGGGTKTAVFKGTVSKGATDTYVAVSPALSDMTCSGGVVTFTLPAEQSYVEGSYDPSACPFMAVSRLEADTLNFMFRSVMSLVRFGLRGEGGVSSLKLTDKAGKSLSGTFSVDVMSNSPSLVTHDGTAAVTLKCVNPVTISTSSDTHFYMAVPAGSLKEGFTLEVLNDKGKTATVSTTFDNTTEANDIKVFSTVAVDFTDKDKCDISYYPVVTIGTQIWMAENYACRKYDTGSEAYNAPWLTDNTIPVSSSAVYTPYCTDPTTVSKPSYMSDEQWGKLGMLYNWAAAVGVEDGESALISDKRQGICPNGWHIPSNEDWKTLQNNLGVTEAGKKMKTSTGWESGIGDGDNGFAALPAGVGLGNDVSELGKVVFYWSKEHAYKSAYDYLIESLTDGLYYSFTGKNRAYSVRCLKD